MKFTPIEEAIYLVVAYSGVFNFPLNSQEIALRLPYQRKINQIELQQTLDNLVKAKKISSNGRYYFLPGKVKSVQTRENQHQLCTFKTEFASQKIGYLHIIPWVKAVFLTGSIAWGNAKKTDDIDLLIITKRCRLWLCRFIINIILDIMGLRRKPKDRDVTNKLCLNMWMDEDGLEIPQHIQNIYTAHELLQAKCLDQNYTSILNFLHANVWVKAYLPYWYKQRSAFYAKKNCERERTFFNFQIIGKFWDLVDLSLYLLQKKYMSRKMTTELVTRHQAFFHPYGGMRDKILRSYSTFKKSIS